MVALLIKIENHIKDHIKYKQVYKVAHYKVEVCESLACYF